MACHARRDPTRLRAAVARQECDQGCGGRGHAAVARAAREQALLEFQATNLDARRAQQTGRVAAAGIDDQNLGTNRLVQDRAHRIDDLHRRAIADHDHGNLGRVHRG